MIEVTGTSVDITVPGKVASSSAPERICDSMSESLPSWLFGKSWMATLPLVSAAMASIASFSRTLTECVTGRSVPSLNLNSGLPWAWAKLLAKQVASAVPASVLVPRNCLRVKGLAMLSPGGGSVNDELKIL